MYNVLILCISLARVDDKYYVIFKQILIFFRRKRTFSVTRGVQAVQPGRISCARQAAGHQVHANLYSLLARGGYRNELFL